jgi:hypothetical protein
MPENTVERASLVPPLPRALAVAVDTEIVAQVAVRDAAERRAAVVFGTDLGGVRLIGPIGELRILAAEALRALVELDEATSR